MWATFAWNASGQLSRVASTDATITYEYGAGGMRARKTVESGSASRTTEYFYTGSQLTAERDRTASIHRLGTCLRPSSSGDWKSSGCRSLRHR